MQAPRIKKQETASAEVVSCILILAVLAAGIGIFAAVALPELDTSAEVKHKTELQNSFLSFKTALDKLWILGGPGTYGSMLLPAESAAVHLMPGASLSFQHTEGNATAELLCLSVLPGYYFIENQEYLLEGGAVFFDERLILPAASGAEDAVLLCFAGAEQTILANVPVTVSYRYEEAATYTNVSTLRISGTPYQEYWEETLRGTENLTLLFFSAELEAAA